MKKVTRWMVIFGVAAPLVLGGCAFKGISRGAANGAISGISDAVEQAVFGIVSNVFTPAEDDGDGDG